MSKRLISSGSAFEAVAGYSRAVVDGDWIHVAGTTGFDYATMTISDDLITQTRQAFMNIAAALKEAATTIICGLVDARMKIEIEVTARKGA